MAITGRKPKPEDQRRNRNQPRHDWVEVENKPYRGGPQLPKARPSGRPWPTPTKQWWGVIRAMPHAVLWTKGDWQFALDTAEVVAAFHDGDSKQAVELRLRDKTLGMTMDARRDLRIRYVDTVTQEQPASITAIEDYRRTLEK